MNELDQLRSQMYSNMGGGDTPPPPSDKAFSDPFQNMIDYQNNGGNKPVTPPTAPSPVPPVAPNPVTQTIEQPVKSATQQMREKMAAQGNNGTPTTMKQGYEYNPTTNLGTTQEPKGNPNGSTDTVINTTRQAKTKKPKERKEKESKGGLDLGAIKGKFATVGVVVVAVLVGIVWLSNGGGKEGTDSESAPTPTTTIQSEYTPPTPTPWMYSSMQLEELRKVGYTGTEIEMYAKGQIDYNRLIEDATQKRDAWIQEAIAPLYDETSDEFKEIMNDTWLGLPENNYADTWENTYSSYSVRKNLDYEKVDPHGGQLFIKIFFNEPKVIGEYFFVNVTPEEWMKLRDSGNVIVNYKYVTQFKSDAEKGYYSDEDEIIITGATLEIIE